MITRKRLISYIVIGNIILNLLAWFFWPVKTKEAQAQACITFSLASCTAPGGCTPSCGARSPIAPAVQSGIGGGAYGLDPYFVIMCYQ